MNEVCPGCFDGAHGECIGNGCYCDCQLDLEGPRESGRVFRYTLRATDY